MSHLLAGAPGIAKLRTVIGGEAVAQAIVRPGAEVIRTEPARFQAGDGALPRFPHSAEIGFVSQTDRPVVGGVGIGFADGGDRTHTLLPVLDFESSASASSATSALSKEK